jgi:hypothetical protein
VRTTGVPPEPERAYLARSLVSVVRRSVNVLALVALAACDEGDAHFAVRFASGFAPAAHTVSVLGVYKDGLMSSAGWEALAPHLGAALGAGACAPGYDALIGTNAPLASAIDETAQANGPTDELLGQLGPAAKGELVLVLGFAGKLPRKPVHDGGAPTSPGPGSAGMGGRGSGRGMRGGGGRRSGPSASPSDDPNVLELSATAYSVSAGQSVASVVLRYSGASVDEALAKFGAKLAQVLPRMKCEGWNWDVKLDPETIRRTVDE